MKKKLASAKNFVQRHKTGLITTAIVVPTSIMLLQHQGIKSLNEFLQEKDLYDEYYEMNEED